MIKSRIKEKNFTVEQRSEEVLAGNVTPLVSTEICHLYSKTYKSERAKMKENRQNDREIGIQFDNIM